MKKIDALSTALELTEKTLGKLHNKGEMIIDKNTHVNGTYINYEKACKELLDSIAEERKRISDINDLTTELIFME